MASNAACGRAPAHESSFHVQGRPTPPPGGPRIGTAPKGNSASLPLSGRSALTCESGGGVQAHTHLRPPPGVATMRAAMGLADELPSGGLMAATNDKESRCDHRAGSHRRGRRSRCPLSDRACHRGALLPVDNAWYKRRWLFRPGPDPGWPGRCSLVTGRYDRRRRRTLGCLHDVLDLRLRDVHAVAEWAARRPPAAMSCCRSSGASQQRLSDISPAGLSPRERRSQGPVCHSSSCRVSLWAC